MAGGWWVGEESGSGVTLDMVAVMPGEAFSWGVEMDSLDAVLHPARDSIMDSEPNQIEIFILISPPYYLGDEKGLYQVPAP